MKLCTCFVLLRIILSGVFVRFYFFPTWKYPDFPGRPVVKTAHFHCRGKGSISSWETKILPVTCHGQKIKIENIQRSVHTPYHSCKACRSSIITCWLAHWDFKITHHRRNFILSNSKLFLLQHSIVFPLITFSSFLHNNLVFGALFPIVLLFSLVCVQLSICVS